MANYEKGPDGGGSKKVPHDYIDAVCREFGVSIRWLVNGTLPQKEVPVDIAYDRLAVIGRVVNGHIDDETVRKLAATPPAEGGHADAIALEGFVPPEDPQSGEGGG